ncbi:MAG TPA: replication-associated recombination protein A, partial [Prolixibacteraceae bacterium]|nr:replication-associated recombination protein A [Prolixibacteraceae bacterium]
ARIIASTLDRPFHTLSAINSGVKDIREVIDKAGKQQFFGRPNPILFIDEIHRFSKSQQDSLLGAVESGVITLIGATTENPSFEVITPLLSRCQVYILHSLEKDQLLTLLDYAITRDVELKKKNIVIRENEALLRVSGGDARKLYNALELVVNALQGETIEITNDQVLTALQRNLAIYDKQGEMHYDIISAFIKSVRGSDPDAAVYWLARMISGGEDVKFIARRMVILAAEDIGLANPNALLLAQSTFNAVHQIGNPEARIILSECAIYLATSPKSNSAYAAIDTALGLVESEGDQPVPLHLRNAPTKLMKDLGYGKEYKYAHSFEGNFADQEFLPEKIRKKRIYIPQDNPSELKILERLRLWWGNRF